MPEADPVSFLTSPVISSFTNMKALHGFPTSGRIHPKMCERTVFRGAEPLSIWTLVGELL